MSTSNCLILVIFHYYSRLFQTPCEKLPVMPATAAEPAAYFFLMLFGTAYSLI